MGFLRKAAFCLVLLGLAFSPLLERAEPAAALEELQQITEKIEETKDELSRKAREEKSVLNSLLRAQQELQQIESELEEIEENIKITQEAVAVLQRELAGLEREIAALEEQRRGRRKTLNHRLVAIYKYGAVNYLELLFSAESFADLVSRFETVSYFLRHDLALLEEMLETGEVLAQKQREFTAGEELLLAQHRNYTHLKEKAAGKQRQKAVLVQETKTELAQIQDDLQRLEAALDELERISREIEEQIRKRQRAGESLGTGKMIWPARGRISSPFGWRRHPILKTRRFHSGIDIAVSTGTPVQAADGGRVLLSGWNGGYGYFVVIDHGNSISSAYAHNSRLLVKEDDVVTKGQTIAVSGSTGWSTGPHLHFEVRENGTPVDPIKYLP